MKTVKSLMVVLLFLVSSVARAQSPETIVKSLGEMLNRYCLEYYNRDFSGRYYVKGSLTITTPTQNALNPLTGGFFLEGKHSYKGKANNTHSNVDWKANVKIIGEGKYKVKFDKYYEADPVPRWLGGQPGHWEEGVTREFSWDGF